MEQHYILEPTRQASRWRRDYEFVLLRTTSLEEAARLAEEKRPNPPNVDLFLRIRDEEDPMGYRPVTDEILDEYYALRRKVRNE